MGMSWVRPLGSERLIDIGSESPASSVIARAIESLIVSSIGTNAGAPIASCRDLAPIILAFSNLVSFAGPMRISKPSSAARFAFLLSLEAAIVTKKNPERYEAFLGTGISVVLAGDSRSTVAVRSLLPARPAAIPGLYIAIIA
jgi:hypothetical protein